MSCEWVVFHSEFVKTLDAADEAYHQSAYHETSRPPGDKSARKWRLKDALVSTNPRLTHSEIVEVCDENSGVAETRPCLSVEDWQNDESITFYLYDDAVEIHLPQCLEQSTPKVIVREALSYVDLFAREGFRIVFDAWEEVLIDPAKDMSALVARYEEALREIAEEDAKAPPAPTITAKALTPSGLVDDEPEQKPWWKFW
ncbi:MAG: hypothetical protein ACKVX7_06350 [Planctomycetota bacterium]